MDSRAQAKLTHEVPIQSEKYGQFVLGVQHEATTNDVTKAFPFWFVGLHWPFKFMMFLVNIAIIMTIPKSIRIIFLKN
jgi:hypothetical protein